MNKKAQRIGRIFQGVIDAQGGEHKAQLTERAIWMSARELGAGQIRIFVHGEGHGIEVPLSPSAVMQAFDKDNDDDDDGITVFLSAAPDDFGMEIYGSNSRERDSNVYTWEDMLDAARPQREAPSTITIDGREYTLHYSGTTMEAAERARDTIRDQGKNAQIRKKAGMFRVYIRDKAPRKAPAKKAAKKKAAKKAPAKKAAKKKTPQPKAKKPSSKKKAGGKGKA